MENKYLVKETMADMRNLSADEVTYLEDATYKGIELLGYYHKGDTPSPIHYYVSDTTLQENGGSIVDANGLKLEHNFATEVDVQYFGVIGIDSYSNINQVPERSLELQKFEDYRLSRGLLGVFNNLGHIKISIPIQVTENINWVNQGYKTGIENDKRIHVYAESLFRRKSNGTSSIFGKLIGLNIEKKSLSSDQQSIKTDLISSKLFDNISLRSFDLSYNTIKHFGTIVFGGLSNLVRIQFNRFHSIWFALISSYSNKNPRENALSDSITDSYITFNYINFDVQGEETALFKGVRMGHVTFNGNFSDFCESVVDNSVISLAQYWTTCMFTNNIFDYFINFSKGSLYNCDVKNNFFMNMTVKSATTFDPPVNWGLYGADRIKSMEWGLFKNPSSLIALNFENNSIHNIDFIIKHNGTLVASGVNIRNNQFLKPSTPNGRNSSVLYSISELKSKIKVALFNNTILNKGQQNNMSDLGYITDRVSPTSVMYDKASTTIDSCYQISAYNTNNIDDVRGLAIGESPSINKLLKVSSSGKVIAITSKADLKVTGRKYAFEIAEDLLDNRLFQNDTLYCVELGSLSFVNGKLVDSNGFQRLLNTNELVSYSINENLLVYVYDLGAFVQISNSSTKMWRGNNLLTINQITNISPSMSLIGTSLPTEHLIPDRPFILIDTDSNILEVYKVNSNYIFAIYNIATKIRYEELFRDYGIQNIRPRYFISNGFTFFNTELKTLQIYNNGSWDNVTSNASPEHNGLVKQSMDVQDSTVVLPVAANDSTATSISDLKQDYNDLVLKYNSLLTVVADIQSKLNSKLMVDRQSGQQFKSS